MNKLHLKIVVVIIVLGIIGLIALFMKGNGQDSAREIAKASAEFKANPGFRQDTASKLVPHLKIGMTTDEVESLLGKPDNEREYGEGMLHEYGVFYSQFIDIRFDSNGQVEEVIACAPGLGDESVDGNKPSGYYKLEK